MIGLHYIRTGILALHNLKIENFPSFDDAMAAADAFIKFQRTHQVAEAEWKKHEDEIHGHVLCDRFWYCKHLGIRG